jgi:hypothetical protein
MSILLAGKLVALTLNRQRIRIADESVKTAAPSAAENIYDGARRRRWRWENDYCEENSSVLSQLYKIHVHGRVD